METATIEQYSKVLEKLRVYNVTFDSGQTIGDDSFFRIVAKAIGKDIAYLKNLIKESVTNNPELYFVSTVLLLQVVNNSLACI